jgi:hypothetical protein
MSKHIQGGKSWPMPLVVVGVLGICLPLLTCWRSSPVGAQQTPPAGAPGGAPGAAAPAPALDEPLQWMYEARKAYAKVRDYQCTLVKQERVQGGVLTPQDIILMKFRQSPFSVNMQWLSPRETAGQEVSFIYGRNNNQMRVRFAKGLKKLVNYVNVDPFDRRVMERSRHHIYEAGIGNLIEQTIKNMEMEKRLNKTQVSTADYRYNDRECLRVESTRTERMRAADGRDAFYCYRSVLYLDKERKLPLRTENYDWPYQGGPAGGELLEVFSFVDLRLNVGLTDADFAR